MAMGKLNLYNRFKQGLGDGATTTKYDLAGATIKVAIVTSAYSPDYDAHAFFSDITNELATANGYTAGGYTLATKTWTKSGTGTAAKYVFTSAAPAWTATGAGFTGRRAIMYISTGTAATSQLIGEMLLDSTPADFSFTTSNSPVSINPDATNGWFAESQA